MTEEEQKEAQEVFDAKTKALHEDLKEICEKHGVGLVTSIYFKEEDLAGTHVYGKLNHMEEMGLAKLMEQKFLA